MRPDDSRDLLLDDSLAEKKQRGVTPSHDMPLRDIRRWKRRIILHDVIRGAATLKQTRTFTLRSGADPILSAVLTGTINTSVHVLRGLT